MAEENKKQQEKKERKEDKAASKISEAEKNLEPISENKTEEIKKEVEKKKPVEQKKEKKTEAVAHGFSYPVSKKHSMYICNFIKNKSIDESIAELEKVAKLKKAIPFKGEIPHRKGMGSGRYPVSASQQFIKLLKSLKGNVIQNGLELEKTRIYLASPSWAARPARSNGRKAKRTNIILKAKEFPIKTTGENK